MGQVSGGAVCHAKPVPPMTGKERYHQAVTKARQIVERELKMFNAGTLKRPPCSGDRERKAVIEAMDEMQAEIDRQHAILKAAGLDGAVGASLVPHKQGFGGMFG